MPFCPFLKSTVTSQGPRSLISTWRSFLSLPTWSGVWAVASFSCPMLRLGTGCQLDNTGKGLEEKQLCWSLASVDRFLDQASVKIDLGAPVTLQLCRVFEVVFFFFNVAFFFVFREGLIQLTIARSSLSIFFSLALLSIVLAHTGTQCFLECAI